MLYKIKPIRKEGIKHWYMSQHGWTLNKYATEARHNRPLTAYGFSHTWCSEQLNPETKSGCLGLGVWGNTGSNYEWAGGFSRGQWTCSKIR